MNTENTPSVIFYAEDDHFTRNTMCLMLNKLGHGVQSFENGQDLWDALQDILKKDGALPALIITDNQMPEMTGLDLLRELEGADNPLSGIPRLMVSGDDVGEDAVRHGAVFLKKPFYLQRLKKAIQTALEEGTE